MQVIQEQQPSIRERRIADYAWCFVLIIAVNIAIFHSGLYSYLCRPDSYAGNIYGRLAILKEIESQSNVKPVAIMGDSTIEDGISARQITQLTNKATVNMAMPATGPLVWLHYFRSIDPDRDRFSSIILMITPQDVRTVPHEEGVQSLFAIAPPHIVWDYLSKYEDPSEHFGDFYASIDRLYAFRRDLKDLLLSPDRLFSIRNNRKQYVPKLKAGHDERSDVCGVELNPTHQKVVRWGRVKDRDLRQVINKTLTRTHRLNQSPRIDGMLEPVEEIVAHYRGANTRILIVSFPFGWDHHVDPQHPVIQSYNARLNKMDSLPSVYLWDATSLSLFQDCANYYDFRHLNVRGRQLFSSALAQVLKQHAL